jgi:hypothetical protein
MKVIKLEDVIRFLELETLEKKIIKKATHGSCCTCQKCGYDYDSCVCEHNETIDFIEKSSVEVKI